MRNIVLLIVSLGLTLSTLAENSENRLRRFISPVDVTRTHEQCMEIFQNFTTVHGRIAIEEHRRHLGLNSIDEAQQILLSDQIEEKPCKRAPPGTKVGGITPGNTVDYVERAWRVDKNGNPEMCGFLGNYPIYSTSCGNPLEVPPNVDLPFESINQVLARNDLDDLPTPDIYPTVDVVCPVPGLEYKVRGGYGGSNQNYFVPEAQFVFVQRGGDFNQTGSSGGPRQTCYTVP